MGRNRRSNTTPTPTAPASAPAPAGASTEAPAVEPAVTSEQPAVVAAAVEPGQAPEETPMSSGAPAASPDPADPTPSAQETEGQDEPPADDVEASGPLDAPEPDAHEPHPADPTPEGDALLRELFEPTQPSIDSVMGELLPASAGAVLTRPEVHLTGEQAVLQLRVYETLCKQGKTLRSQGDVYGWILGQMLGHLGN